jgi:copper(I)-binding protein
MRLQPPALALALACMAAAPAMAGDIAVRDAWTRATPKGSDGAVIYLSVVNSGSAPDALVGLSSPVAKVIRLHVSAEMPGMPGMMGMKEVASIPVPAHATVRLEPMGSHAMVSGLGRSLKVGQSFPLTVRFQRGGAQTVKVQVRSLSSMPSMPSMPGM